MNIQLKEIVSATDFIKNFSSYRKMVKEQDKIVIFKNNKPDLVLIDIDAYARIMEFIEDQSINNLIEERDKLDMGKRFSMDEVIEMCK